MALNYFTLLHVLISLVGIATGFGALAGLLAGQYFPRWVGWFLATTLATSLTGFMFPFNGFTPGIGVGILSVILLGVAIYALYVRRLAGGSRLTFLVTSVAALYFNVFVGVVQLFQKFPALAAIAPKQKEPAFAATQGLVLVTFLILGIAVAKRFRGDAVTAK